MSGGFLGVVTVFVSSNSDRPVKRSERVVGGYMALVPKSADSVAD